MIIYTYTHEEFMAKQRDAFRAGFMQTYDLPQESVPVEEWREWADEAWQSWVKDGGVKP